MREGETQREREREERSEGEKERERERERKTVYWSTTWPRREGGCLRDSGTHSGEHMGSHEGIALRAEQIEEETMPLSYGRVFNAFAALCRATGTRRGESDCKV
jgi:hypothetical protein